MRAAADYLYVFFISVVIKITLLIHTKFIRVHPQSGILTAKNILQNYKIYIILQIL